MVIVMIVFLDSKQQYCSSCSAGTYSQSGASFCITCQTNYWSTTTSSSCTKCDSSCKTCNNENGKCTSCYSGYNFVSTSGQCLACDAGYYSKGGQNSCSQCEEGTYSSHSGSSTCTNCDSLCKTCSKTTGQCLTCYSGYIVSGGNCVACSAGTCSSNNKCVTCPLLTYSTGGKSVCTNCDTSCKSCDNTNGNCLSCFDGMAKNGKTCVECAKGYYSQNYECSQCQTGTFSSSTNTSNCMECSDRTFSNITGSISCTPCNGICKSPCEKKTGNCVDCLSGYILNNGNCSICLAGTYTNLKQSYCLTCPAGTYSLDGASSCDQCPTNYWSSSGTSVCFKCDSSCLTCDKTNGKCTSCYSGNALNSNGNCNLCPIGTSLSNGKCTSCSEGTYQDKTGQLVCKPCDSICQTCSKTTGNCITCVAGHELINSVCTSCEEGKYSLGGNSVCVNCPSECQTCIKESGTCSSCKNGLKRVGDECVSCSDTGKCLSCDSNIIESARKCSSCEEDNYLYEGSCYLCTEINTKCIRCSKTTKSCYECSGSYISTGDSCALCAEGMVKSGTVSCVNCYEKIPNCKTCDYNNGIIQCTLCFAPYILNDNKLSCIDANNNSYHYNSTTNNGSPNQVGCIKQVDKTCIKCNDSLIIEKGECYNIKGNCTQKSTVTCDVCENDIITTNWNCFFEQNMTCKYQKTNENKKCLQCQNIKKGDDCNELIANCVISQNNYCYIPTEGFYIANISVEKCDESTVCINKDKTIIILRCSGNKILNEKIDCLNDEKCETTESSECIKCIDNYYIQQGLCVLNNNKCLIQYGNECLACKDGILSDGLCYTYDEINCGLFTYTCKRCEDGYYKEEHSCVSKEQYPNCTHISVVEKSCVHCDNEYNLEDGKCNKKAVQKEYSLYLKCTNKNIKADSNETHNCFELTESGCLRCLDGYYLDKMTCKKCEEPCVKCSNQTYCTGCNAYSNNKDGTCEEINSLIEVCEVMMSTYTGCVKCKDGYYKSMDGKQCNKCDISCETCMNEKMCLSCSENYYQSNSHSLCLNQNELIHCVNKTRSGCTLCEFGYFIYQNECQKCKDNCTSCDANEDCSSCEDNYILQNGECLIYSSMDNCISSSYSKCSQCAKNYKLNDDQNLCVKQNKYFLYIGIPVIIVCIVIIILTIIILTLFVLIFKKKEEKKMTNICVFKIKRSNVTMKKLDNDILVNKSDLSFNENDVKIPVEQSTRELLCVGTQGKGNMKIQITTRENCDEYDIRTEPKIVTMKSGYACEFEIFITPKCTLKTQDNFVIVSLNLLTGITTMTNFPFSVETEESTKLNYKELIEEKVLGEGSFGIVYKGTFRGNVVAIKKMKQSGNESLKSGDLSEFENEVSMLDKFR
ncbi:hypothetical protein EIN_142450, partial [Entamoeba invadens IP1]